MTMRPKIIVTRQLPPDVEARLARLFDCHFNPDDTAMKRDDLLQAAADADGLLVTITDPIDQDFIPALPEKLQIIASFGVGYEHVDTDAARARGLIVTNTPDVLTDATADLAMLLLLGASRRAGEGEALIRDGQFPPFAPYGMLGQQITGKRLGIYGLGRIGAALAKRAEAHGMTICYHNRKPVDDAPYDYAPSLKRLAEMSDVLAITCASTPATRNSINSDVLGCLGPEGILVNVARGDIVDDQALIDALQTGQIWAAGLDVFAGEPNADPRYRTLKNTFLLPHLGSATMETRSAMGHRAVDNLEAFFSGEAVPDPV